MRLAKKQDPGKWGNGICCGTPWNSWHFYMCSNRPMEILANTMCCCNKLSTHTLHHLPSQLWSWETTPEVMPLRGLWSGKDKVQGSRTRSPSFRQRFMLRFSQTQTPNQQRQGPQADRPSPVLAATPAPAGALGGPAERLPCKGVDMED